MQRAFLVLVSLYNVASVKADGEWSDGDKIPFITSGSRLSFFQTAVNVCRFTKTITGVVKKGFLTSFSINICIIVLDRD